MTDSVDLVCLSRDDRQLAVQVREGIANLKGVHLNLHRVIGTPRTDDACRWETIARARNQGKRLGTARWLMFLDDDVVLHPGCVKQLLKQLKRYPTYAAFAADYLGERVSDGPALHVSMGATLFRRTVLDQIKFRWEHNKCECRCCCDDLRQRLLAIDYWPKARAKHL